MVVEWLVATLSNHVDLMRVPVLCEDFLDVVFVPAKQLDVLAGTLTAYKSAVGNVRMGRLKLAAIDAIRIELVFDHKPDQYSSHLIRLILLLLFNLLPNASTRSV